MKDTKDRDRAALRLDAVEVSPGEWVYLADETNVYYAVTAESLEALERHCRRHDPADAYSMWCTVYGAEATEDDISAYLHGWVNSGGAIENYTLWEKVFALVFITPPENQGQTITISYASDGERVYRETRDRSCGDIPGDSGRTVIECAQWADLGDMQWGPQNGAPPVPERLWIPFAKHTLYTRRGEPPLPPPRLGPSAEEE